ncbi:MAG TPA: MBL fold metallo-hydrolase [Spirochaetia bacterium]|nr:MBL fold metallo-hydrolase [Spirochaetales bacterium]HRY80667.1 MBL fold metallo-hydrolase [Spirochaetia bacterium]HRZ88288.1 MBL fold metallo-hydrolase [Spirochaetia bacterium]
MSILINEMWPGAAILGSVLLAAACAGGPGSATRKDAEARAEQEAADRSLAGTLMASVPGRTMISRVNRDALYQTSFLIVSKSGTVIVADPYQVLPGIEADIVISTHKDHDHNDPEFYSRTKARTSRYVLESFTVKDVSIYTVAASHYGDDFDPAAPTDVIYLLDLDDLRIAVMGDIAQTRLTDAQLSAMGAVDVAIVIMELAPKYGYSLENTRTMLDQLRPRLAFPIHPSEEVVRGVAEAMGGLENASWRYVIDPETLRDESARVVTLAPLP